MRFHKKCTKILYGVSVFVYWFLDYYNTINDFIFIYLSYSLRHVSASNYCRRRVVLQLYKKKKWGTGLSFTGRTETDASPLQEELRQKPLLYRKNWDRSLSFTIKLQTCNFVIIPNNYTIKCIPVKQSTRCGIPAHKVWVVGILYVTVFRA